MKDFSIHSVGKIINKNNDIFIAIEKKYIPALQALDGFSHINVLWWFDDLDDEQSRSVLQTEQPYKGAPKIMGVFATRSPERPNPIALTTTKIIDIDFKKGIIKIEFIDANNNTPVLDIKPYTPSLDRVETPDVPAWCSHWPKSTEESAYFSWEKEFNF